MRAILLTIIGLSTFVCADFFNNNGIVTDSKTILQWQDDYSSNSGIIKTATWQGAIDYCEALNLDGLGWRLPNKKELLSIIDYIAFNPSISAVFTNTASTFYWSSTTDAGSTSYGWIVNFGTGYTYTENKTTFNYNVRCVREGQ